jgi:hypothetical protein
MSLATTSHLLALLALLGSGADTGEKSGDKAGDKAKVAAKPRGHATNACPFVAMGDVDKEGAVTNLFGADLPKDGTGVVAFDTDGKLGDLRVTGDRSALKFNGAVPARLSAMTFSHVLLVEKSVGVTRLIQPGKDLPLGIGESAVQLLVGDSSGPKAVLVSLPVSEDDDSTCDEISAKVRGSWKVCWSSCPHK